MNDRKNRIGRELGMLNNMIRRRISVIADDVPDSDITVTGRRIIGFLAHNRDRDIFQRDIETEFTVRRPTASQTLKQMEERGFILRESVPYDRRLKKLTLTEKSLKLHEAAVACFERFDAMLVDGLTDDEADAFLATIEKIKLNLTDDALRETRSGEDTETEGKA